MLFWKGAGFASAKPAGKAGCAACFRKVGFLLADARVLKVKGSFAPLASQADGRVTFVLETKVTKNSFKSARLGRRNDRLWGLNGDTAGAFVMTRSRLSEGFVILWSNPQLRICDFVGWTRHAARPQDWLVAGA